MPPERTPGGGRWPVLLAVVAAIAVGFGISLLITGGDDDDDAPAEVPASGVSVPAELEPAEASAIRLVEAANTSDCDTVRQLAVERVADLLTAELNCNNPQPAVVEIASSAIVDDDPVVVAITLADGEDTLVVEVEMIQQGTTWLANEFDAAS